MERRVGSSFSKRLTKCEGLPLPGMVVGGLLSRKEKKRSHHERKYLKSWMAEGFIQRRGEETMEDGARD